MRRYRPLSPDPHPLTSAARELVGMARRLRGYGMEDCASKLYATAADFYTMENMPDHAGRVLNELHRMQHGERNEPG